MTSTIQIEELKSPDRCIRKEENMVFINVLRWILSQSRKLQKI